MLRRLLLNRTTTNWPIVIQKCRLSSDNSYQTTLMAVLGNMWRSGKAPNPQQKEPIPDGSSRSWELGNPENLCVCIGGVGPIHLDDNINVYNLIDFHNKKTDKLHIEMQHCPKLLATKLMKSFPKMSLRTDSLRIIKLSYHKYRDQNKGKLDCIIAANVICKRMFDDGDFGFYSGAATQNSNDELLFHKCRMLRTNDNEIHSTVRWINGYLHIHKLDENESGIIYTDSPADTMQKFRNWINSF